MLPVSLCLLIIKLLDVLVRCNWRRVALVMADFALVQLDLRGQLLLRLVDGMHVASLGLVDHLVR